MATMLAQLPISSRRTLSTEAWRRNPPLVALVLAMLVVAAVALLGLVVDPRVITGAPAWMKPLKFAVSIAIYGATLLWMLTFIPDRPRLVAVISWGVFLAFGIEMALMVTQVLRNTTSHFNVATSFDAAVFTTMGAAIAGLWLLNAIVAFLLARRRFAEAPIVWGVRLGLIAGLLGMAVAFLMTQPTPEQELADRGDRLVLDRRCARGRRCGRGTRFAGGRLEYGGRRSAGRAFRRSARAADSAAPRPGAGAIWSDVVTDAGSLATGRGRGGVLDRLGASAHLAGATGSIPDRARCPDVVSTGSADCHDGGRYRRGVGTGMESGRMSMEMLVIQSRGWRVSPFTRFAIRMSGLPGPLASGMRPDDLEPHAHGRNLPGGRSP